MISVMTAAYDNQSTTDSSDCDHKEIDYPDDEDRSISSDNDDDNNNNDNNNNNNDYDSIIRYMHERSEEDQWDEVQRPLSHTICCICLESKELYPHRIDEMDHYPSQLPHHDQLLMNPCQRHTICVSCLKATLQQNTMALFRDGQGNLPCLGDPHCQNALGQRTTTFVYQMRDLFTDREWETIVNGLNLYRRSQYNSERHPHSFVVPLMPRTQVTLTHLHQHLTYLMAQDQPRLQCPICMVVIEKTTACYAIRHCDWEMCWMCGLIERRLDALHWQRCPRYDSNSFWSVVPSYKCVEGQCFNEDHLCCIPHHQHGIQCMQKIRQSYQVMRCYESCSNAEQVQLQTLFTQHNQLAAFQTFQTCYLQHSS